MLEIQCIVDHHKISLCELLTGIIEQFLTTKLLKDTRRNTAILHFSDLTAQKRVSMGGGMRQHASWNRVLRNPIPILTARRRNYTYLYVSMRRTLWRERYLLYT